MANRRVMSWGTEPLWADEIRVAVASNVTGAARVLVERFEAETGHEVVLAFGSTGKHYAQIRNGAPFHVFLAADVERPRRLEEEGIAVDGSRFTYARGALVLWSPEPGYVDDQGRVLSAGDYRFLALANPGLRPMGGRRVRSLRYGDSGSPPRDAVSWVRILPRPSSSSEQATPNLVLWLRLS